MPYWTFHAADISIYTDAVHRLSELGAVLTHISRLAFRTRRSTPSGVMIWPSSRSKAISFSRCEMFDEADLDTALARFEELQPQATAAGRPSAERHCRNAGTLAQRGATGTPWPRHPG